MSIPPTFIQGEFVRSSPGRAVDYETLTVDNTSGGVALTTTKIAKCLSNGYIVAVLGGAEIRFTTDTTAPTTAVGIPLEVGQQLTVTGPNDLLQFRAIRTGAVSGTLYVQYFAGY